MHRTLTASRRTLTRAVAALAAALVLGVVVPALPAQAVTSCGNTIYASTTLVMDITDCAGFGIRIGASNVVLDLGGHVIDGDGPPLSGSGVVIGSGQTNVTVRNGTIRDFNEGVWVEHNVKDSKVTGLKLTANGYGVENNQLATGLAITGNRISDNAYRGVALYGNSHRIKGNAVHDNGAGIFVSGEFGPGSGNVVTGNQAFRNYQQEGIFIYEANNTVLSFNQVFQNNQRGIRVVGNHSKVQVISNSANANGEDGIEVFAAGSLIKGNSANLNGGGGIRAQSMVVDGGGNKAAGNALFNCVGVICS